MVDAEPGVCGPVEGGEKEEEIGGEKDVGDGGGDHAFLGRALHWRN